ncbi:Levodione reductase [Sphaceloma murrayae]|uniref:Levodione reductase n=1 Tax=Sphaceloma murrayae TaxID=2082308 RepID=A0A2K1QI64_9PEZI|nr:Levodione reductase [Sphaceloma murrayae]
MLADLQDKVIIVTGASSGIGLATTRLLLQAGCKVFGCDLNSLPEDDTLKTTRLQFKQCDLSAAGAPKEVVDACVAAFGGRIHGLCNVAGIADANASADTITDDSWDRIMRVNLTTPVYLMREVIPYMLKHGGGSIANVASKAGQSGAVAGIAYTSSKHGLVGATKNVAWRFVEEKIRCNAICPGGVKTNIVQSADMSKIDQAAYGKMKHIHAAHFEQGIAEAVTQARVLAFLMSDMSSEITGAILPVDHGWSTI